MPGGAISGHSIWLNHKPDVRDRRPVSSQVYLKQDGAQAAAAQRCMPRLHRRARSQDSAVDG
jgi:hypothetical protein